MATQNINMNQASGGCQTVKYNGNTVKKIILDGVTIWTHKTKNYVLSSWQSQSPWEWELKVDSSGNSLDNWSFFYTSYSSNSSTGKFSVSGKVSNINNLKSGTYYYRGNWHDRTDNQDYVYRYKFNTSGKYLDYAEEESNTYYYYMPMTEVAELEFTTQWVED